VNEAYATETTLLSSGDLERVHRGRAILADAWRRDSVWVACAEALVTAMPHCAAMVGAWGHGDDEFLVRAGGGGCSVDAAEAMARELLPIRSRVYSPCRLDPDRNRVVRPFVRWRRDDPEYAAAFVDVFHRHGLGPTVRLNRSISAGRLTSFNVFLADGSREPTVRDATLLRFLQPQLTRTADTVQWLGSASRRRSGLTNVLDVLSDAAFLFDGMGRVLYANGPARCVPALADATVRAGIAGRENAPVPAAQLDVNGRTAWLFVVATPGNRAESSSTPATRLSPRLRRVADLVVRGLGDKQIADEMNLTHASAREYVKRVYRTLGVRSRVELARVIGGDGGAA